MAAKPTVLDRLRSLRFETALSRSGLEDKAFAVAVGVTQGSVSHWKNPARNHPKGKNLIRVSEVLGVSVEYLLGADEMTDEQREREIRLLELVRAAEMPELLDLLAQVPPAAAVRALRRLARRKG